MSDHQLQPSSQEPNSPASRAYTEVGPPTSVAIRHSGLIVAILTCLMAVLIVAGIILVSMRQRNLDSNLQQTLSESKARGLLEMKLLDRALAMVHDEKIERGNEVSRLDSDLAEVRRITRKQASELFQLKHGLVQADEAIHAQTFGFKQVEQRLASMHRDAQDRKKQLANLDRVLSLLNDPDAQQVVFGRRALNQPRGKVYASANQMVILLASNLPPVPSGKTYEFWLIPKGASPSPGGLFQSDIDGSAIHMAEMNKLSPAAVAVSVEEEAGAPQPTTKPVPVVEIPAELIQ